MYSKQIKRNDYERIFFSIMFFLFFLWLILLFSNPDGSQKNIFFRGCKDFFADFFNVLRYIDGRDPYFTTVGSASQHAYLPICYLIFYPFTVFNDYSNMSLQECWTSVSAMMSVMMYSIFCCFLLFHSLLMLSGKLVEKYNVKYANTLSIWAVLFSNVFLFSIERGNIILLSAVFINYFLVFYDSEKKSLRIFAAFSIALAATLKIYPVFFGLLYFEKKQWKEIIFAFVFGISLTLLPFFFFDHGIGGLPQLMRNIREQSNAVRNNGGLNYLYGFSGLVYHFFKSIGTDVKYSTIIASVSTIIIRLMVIASLVLSAFIKDNFTKIALVVFSIIFFPLNSGFYQGLYLFPVLLLYFVTIESRNNIKNLLILFFIMSPEKDTEI